MSAETPAIDAGYCQGAWRRLLISVPGEPIDTLTWTEWLQGPELFVDLRQPAGLAGAVTASCLAEVTLDDARLLATQEGFAGSFVLAGDLAEWQRTVDFRPCALGDRGRLEPHGDLMIETGVEAVYTEYWQRLPRPDGSDPATSGVSGAARFVRDDGAPVILVRYGMRFGYARGRAGGVVAQGELAAQVARADTEVARRLIDCEIALGTITPEGWRIERSSLPWRQGDLLLESGACIADGRLVLADVDPAGRPVSRTLALEALHGCLIPSAAPFAASAAGLAAPAALPALQGGPFHTVPIVDIAALGGGDPQAEAAAIAALGTAASQVGFLHVTGHGIAPAVIARLQSAATAFFALPDAEKMACYIGRSAHHRGYVPEGEETLGNAQPGAPRDRKEAFDLALDLAPGVAPAGHPMLGPNQWPALAGFREDVMAYYAAVFGVGRRLLRGFASALGRPADSLEALVTMPPSQLRLIHYPHDPAAVDAPGIGAHTDYECFTLLLATGPGLEVMNEAGEWIDAPPVPGALVVNIGDMLEYWSGGRFVATSHRVRKVAQERYSFPLFFALDYDVELRPCDRRSAPPIRTGEHLYAQTVQTFRYLRERAAAGALALPQGALPVSSFGQEARHRQSATDPVNLA